MSRLRKPKPEGRPPYQPTPQERQWVTVAAAGAMPLADIAGKLGVSIGTLRRSCRKELNTGLATCTVQVHANFLRIAAGDSKSAAWAADRWLRMRAPQQWRDAPTQIETPPGSALAVSFRWADATPPPESTEPEPEADASTADTEP
jgi:hypothetical protein